jgi:TolA-binding protein
MIHDHHLASKVRHTSSRRESREQETLPMGRNDYAWESAESTVVLTPSINFLPDWGEERIRRGPAPPPPENTPAEPQPEPVLPVVAAPNVEIAAPPPVANPVIEQARAEPSPPVIHHHHSHGLSGLPLALVIAGSLLLGGLAGALLGRASQTPAPESLALHDSQDGRVTKSDLAEMTALLEQQKNTNAAITARLERIEAQSKPKTEDAALVELKTLREKLENLEHGAKQLEPVPTLVQGISAELKADVARIEQGISAELKGDVARIEQGLNKLLDDRSRVTLRPIYPGPNEQSETYFKRGASLFKQGQYAAAREIFLGITEAAPADARAWYYAALTNAFVTGQFDRGETMVLAGKAADCERASTTDRSQIDSTFASLSKAQGADWIAFYRSKAQNPGNP